MYDMIIIGSDYSTVEEVKYQLFQEFEMKDLGSLRYFLGIEVATSPSGYLLSQTKYARDILSRANLTDDKIVDTHFQLHAKFSTFDGVPLEDLTLYRELVGCLVYLTVTHPDISYAAGDFSDCKSTSGLCVFLGDSLISWKSKKQLVVARSNTKAEYHAMAHVTSKIVWLWWLLSNMGVSLSDSTSLYCDNQSAVQIAHNSVFHE
ncbi:uncharacterized protein LOC114304242 [Camellia sinensis]|uniref:uncharacterized protein LOC114304242 n=1 Tax=Camellia sinensis TaxID=4442 RepID=UPI001036BE3C|nr:uncharacterized protein LOC114304242 [Camellia sinensis]